MSLEEQWSRKNNSPVANHPLYTRQFWLPLRNRFKNFKTVFINCFHTILLFGIFLLVGNFNIDLLHPVFIFRVFVVLENLLKALGGDGSNLYLSINTDSILPASFYLPIVLSLWSGIEIYLANLTVCICCKEEALPFGNLFRMRIVVLESHLFSNVDIF